MWLSSVFSSALLLVSIAAPPAFARDGDEEACIGKEEGDPCTRSRGEAGVCLPDDSDPDVLKCDDDAGAPRPSGDGGPDDGSATADGAAATEASGCAATGGTGVTAVALGLAALGLAGRRRRA